ncbi:MAG: hypothetical protein HN348_15215 [Proteobacteria bacterium]|nr:hypothetical protein [Pseudomonadota bacterium]
MQAKTILGVALLVLFTLACGNTVAEWPPDLSPKETGSIDEERLAEGIDGVVALSLDTEKLWVSGTTTDFGDVVVQVPTTGEGAPEAVGQRQVWLLTTSRTGLWEAGLTKDVRYTPHADGQTTTIGEGNVRGLHAADRWVCVVWFDEAEGLTSIEARHDDQPRLQHFERAVKGEPLWDPLHGSVVARPDGSCVVAMTTGIHIYENDGSSHLISQIATPAGAMGMTTYWTAQNGTWSLSNEEDELTRLADHKVLLVADNWGYRAVEEDYTSPTTIPGMGETTKLIVGIERVRLGEEAAPMESLVTTPTVIEEAIGSFTVGGGYLYWSSNKGYIARKALPADEPEPVVEAPK